MDKYTLPPRARLANYILLVLLALNAALSAYLLLDQHRSFAFVALGLYALFLIGVARRLPASYYLVAGFGVLSLNIGLQQSSGVAFALGILQMMVALYVRSRIYVRRAEPLQEDGQEPPQP